MGQGQMREIDTSGYEPLILSNLYFHLSSACLVLFSTSLHFRVVILGHTTSLPLFLLKLCSVARTAAGFSRDLKLNVESVKGSLYFNLWNSCRIMKKAIRVFRQGPIIILYL